MIWLVLYLVGFVITWFVVYAIAQADTYSDEFGSIMIGFCGALVWPLTALFGIFWLLAPIVVEWGLAKAEQLRKLAVPPPVQDAPPEERPLYGSPDEGSS